MARFSSAFTYGLMNPSFANKAGEAVGMLGGLGGDLRKQRLLKEKTDAMKNASGTRERLQLAIQQADTPEKALTATKALDEYDRLVTERGQADLTFAQGQVDRDKQANIDAATPLLSTQGIRYDQAIQAGNQEAADNILKGMEVTAGRAGLNVQDFISKGTGTKAKLYDKLSDGMLYNTRTGAIVKANPDGTASVERMTEAQHRDFVQKEADEGGWDLVSLDKYRQAVANGETSQEAAKKHLVTTDSARKIASQKRGAISLIDNQLDIIADVEEVMPETWTEQVWSKTMKWFPGSDAMTISDAMETLEARMAFDELQTMRNNSKTGGALGSVSERELIALKAAFRNLNPASDQFPANLQALKDRYMNILSVERGVPDDFNENGISRSDPQYSKELDKETGETITVWTDRRTGRQYNVATFDEIR